MRKCNSMTDARCREKEKGNIHVLYRRRKGKMITLDMDCNPSTCHIVKRQRDIPHVKDDSRLPDSGHQPPRNLISHNNTFNHSFQSLITPLTEQRESASLVSFLCLLCDL